MPIFNYKCNECDTEFEQYHKVSSTSSGECTECKSNSVKRLVSTSNFKIDGGTSSYGVNGYTGKNRDLVKKLNSDKDYREGYRAEVKDQEVIGTEDYKQEYKMKQANNVFEEMRQAGQAMTPKEKEDLKREYGIKKGMKDIKF
jgi:putative FmdB family regulatory protein